MPGGESQGTGADKRMLTRAELGCSTVLDLKAAETTLDPQVVTIHIVLSFFSLSLSLFLLPSSSQNIL